MWMQNSHPLIQDTLTKMAKESFSRGSLNALNIMNLIIPPSHSLYRSIATPISPLQKNLSHHLWVLGVFFFSLFVYSITQAGISDPNI